MGEVGDAVAKIHDPAQPQEACIDGVTEKYLASLLFGAIGVVFTAVGVWLPRRPSHGP